jgi:4-azaleucine resistance transporter AzlC
VLGYLPIGFAYGILAQEAGLSFGNTVLMSVAVYAGASQFVAAGLFAGGVRPLSIVLTTFVVNLRHMIMSASLVPYLGQWRKRALSVFAYQLTDETFAVHATRFDSGVIDKWEALATNAFSQIAWVTGSWIGFVGGQFLADPRPWGLDYALPALFVALLVLQVRNWVQVGVAVLAGTAAVALNHLGIAHWAVVLATLIAATAGALWESWTNRASP